VLRSDSARHWQDRARQGNQSYSRNQLERLVLAEVEEGWASQGADTEEQEQRQDAQTVDQLTDHIQGSHRESGKDRFRQRTHKCNQQVRQDQ